MLMCYAVSMLFLYSTLPCSCSSVLGGFYHVAGAAIEHSGHFFGVLYVFAKLVWVFFIVSLCKLLSSGCLKAQVKKA